MDDVSGDVSKLLAIHFDDRTSPHATEDERKPLPAISFDDKNPDETSPKDYTMSVDVVVINGLKCATSASHSVLQGTKFVTTPRRTSKSTILATMSSFHPSVFTKDISMMHQTRSLSRLNSLQGQALLLIVMY